MKSILHPTSGRFLEVYSNHPGLQVYTGNMLPHQRFYPSDLENQWRSENTQINSSKSVNCMIMMESYFQNEVNINLEIKSILKLNKHKSILPALFDLKIYHTFYD